MGCGATLLARAKRVFESIVPSHKKVLYYFEGMKLPFGNIRTADEG